MGMYICDGSQKQNTVGAGIVCIVNGEELSYHFREEIFRASSEDAEAFAIMKCLDIAVEMNDYHVSIFNDGRHFIRKLQTKNQPTVNKLKERILDMSKNGYVVELFPTNKYRNHHMNKYIRMAHQLSRTYLKDE